MGQSLLGAAHQPRIPRAKPPSRSKGVTRTFSDKPGGGGRLQPSCLTGSAGRSSWQKENGAGPKRGPEPREWEEDVGRVGFLFRILRWPPRRLGGCGVWPSGRSEGTSGGRTWGAWRRRLLGLPGAEPVPVVNVGRALWAAASVFCVSNGRAGKRNWTVTCSSPPERAKGSGVPDTEKRSKGDGWKSYGHGAAFLAASGAARNARGLVCWRRPAVGGEGKKTQQQVNQVHARFGT